MLCTDRYGMFSSSVSFRMLNYLFEPNQFCEFFYVFVCFWVMRSEYDLKVFLKIFITTESPRTISWTYLHFVNRWLVSDWIIISVWAKIALDMELWVDITIIYHVYIRNKQDHFARIYCKQQLYKILSSKELKNHNWLNGKYRLREFMTVATKKQFENSGFVSVIFLISYESS